MPNTLQEDLREDLREDLTQMNAREIRNIKKYFSTFVKIIDNEIEDRNESNS